MHPSALYTCTNTASMLAQLLSAKRMDELAGLFTENVHVTLPLQEIDIMGKDEAHDYLRSYVTGLGNSVYLLNSPYVFEDDGLTRGSFFLVGYRFEDEMQTMFGSRFDISFDTDYRISALAWYDMYQLASEPGARYLGAKEPRFTVADVLGSTLDAQDMMQIEEMLSLESQLRAVTPKEGYEIQFSPVIYGAENSAYACFTTLSLAYDADDDIYVAKLLNETVALERDGHDDQWHVTRRSEDAIADLSALKPNPATPPHSDQMIGRKLVIPIPENGAGTLSADEVASIRKQGTKWSYAVRSCNPDQFIAEALDANADDLATDVIMPAEGIEGFEAEFNQMREMWEKQPKLQGIHTHATPYVAQLGPNEAEVIWLDLGWTIMGELFGNTDAMLPVLPGFGRYRMKLRRDDDGWKVYNFSWGPLLLHGFWMFDRDAAGGWTAMQDTNPWPGAEETL